MQPVAPVTVAVGILQHYGWLSLAPALVAIILALWTKRVVESLLTGIAVGAWVLDYHTGGWLHSLLYFVPNALKAIAGHPATEALKGLGMTKDADRGALILSVFLIGSFMTILDKSGGALHFAETVTHRIKKEVGALLTAWLVGLSIFTSAYFSILVTGTLMRPIFDRLKISREKLSFYCDGMSAPTKALLPISGWIAYMSILVEENIPTVGPGNGLIGFVQTMPYNLYCWAMMFFILLLSFKWIPDFGPMRAAERRVKGQGLIHKEGSKPMIDPKVEAASQALSRKGTTSDMFVPLICSVFTLLFLGMWNGWFKKWYPDLPKVDISTIQIMNLAFTVGIIVALIKYLKKGLMKFAEFMDLVIEGGKAVMIGAVIIIMAVTLGDMMKAPSPEGLGTAAFIVETVKPYLAAQWIPFLTFLISCLISFATGTSWGTWAIMMPVSVPLAIAAGLNPFLVAGAVLSGGAFGDHCSPISDTTVLSSLAANTDHLEHVRTQLPYAVTVGVLCLVGYLLIGFLTPAVVSPIPPVAF